MNLDEVELDGVGDEYRAQQNQSDSKDGEDDLPTITTEPVGLRLIPSFDQIKIKSDLDGKSMQLQPSPKKKTGNSVEQRVADVRISESAMRNNQVKGKSTRTIEELDEVDISKDVNQNDRQRGT